jgi:hypothetical protein
VVETGGNGIGWKPSNLGVLYTSCDGIHVDLKWLLADLQRLVSTCNEIR